jgi:prolyl-tRNA synthetase
VLAPTHEEDVAWVAKNHISSYRELPQIWYQIQTKFRNEPRPRSGVLRGRQFLMKDSYSLDATWEGLDRSYELHAQAYRNIFTRCGLRFFEVGASSGAMGGSGSQEFMMESASGEDVIVVSQDGEYSANLEVATSVMPAAPSYPSSDPVVEVHTPGVRTIDEVATFLQVNHDRLAKSLAVWADDHPVLVLMLGNDELNESKLRAALGGAEVRPIESERLQQLTGAEAGSIGPVGLKGFRIIADARLLGANRLVSGANRTDYHLMNIDLTRDCGVEGYHDLRTVREGEPSPNGGGKLRIVRTIELGHIFKLGTRYSDSLHATFLDEQGREQPIIMGSYGIGVERIIACHIEQNHDEHGIVWDEALAPYQIHVIAIGGKSGEAFAAADALYERLQRAGFEVLYDDRRDISPGFKFKDADLLGMPYQVIVSEKNLAKGQIEVKERKSGKRSYVSPDTLESYFQEELA